jgi:hypothetical protein
LREYADRGVFRGFTAARGIRGRVDYHFIWLIGRRMHAVFDPARDVLSFPTLFPRIDRHSPIARDLHALVADRTRGAVPGHKRVDGRRARIAAALHRGDWSLAVEIRGANHEYGVRRVLNLINELFLLLHERYPDYLIERFGLSAE